MLLRSLHHGCRDSGRNGSRGLHREWPRGRAESRPVACCSHRGRLCCRSVQRGLARRAIPWLRRNIPDAHQVLWARGGLDCRGRRPHCLDRCGRCLLFDDWLRLDASVGLLALVTLIVALCHKLLGLLPQAGAMAIDQEQPLRRVDRMPFGADVCPASDTDLSSWLHDVGHFLLERSVGLNWRCCRYERGGGGSAVDWRRR